RRRVDLAGLDHGGASGAVWSLPHDGDLDANVVVLAPGDHVDEHVNHEVDVLVVGIAGEGTVTVDGEVLRLDASSIVHVPKGTSRSITGSAPEPLVYLTVHRARSPLGIGRRPPHG